MQDIESTTRVAVDLKKAADRDAMLKRHGFHRGTYKPESLGFLIGNTEIGGLARPDGLGFDDFFLASLWLSPTRRGVVAGPRLEPAEGLGEVTDYAQDLDLRTAVLTTELATKQGLAYRCSIFASQAETALIQIRLVSAGEHAQRWRLVLPKSPGSRQTRIDGRLFHVASAPGAYTRGACAVTTSKPSDEDDDLVWLMQPGEVLQVSLACTTEWEGLDFADRAHGVAIDHQRDDGIALRAHVAAMDRLWLSSAWVSLPDIELERLYYRSVYWLFSTSGSRYALPQETPLADVDGAWRGVAFTYGFGWGILAWTALGHPQRARRMLRRMHRPAGQARNARILLEKLSPDDVRFFMDDKDAEPPSDNSDVVEFGLEQFGCPCHYAAHPGADGARAFGHQISIYGDDRMRRGHQRHIDGFAAALAYRLDQYYPDECLRLSTVYPMLRGAAEFWVGLLRWDKAAGGFITPLLHSASENLDGRNVSDNVLSAKWLLRQAAEMAERLGVDPEQRQRWAACADGILIPQNQAVYLEHLDQQELRREEGYFGVRFPVYFGFPGWELAHELDKGKVHRTFAAVIEATNGHKGMISFVASAFAASAATFGDGHTWLLMIRRNLITIERDSGALQEVEGLRPYFHTSYAAYVCAVLAGLLRSDGDGDTVFPGVPASWRQVIGWNLPASGGRRLAITRDIHGDSVEAL